LALVAFAAKYLRAEVADGALVPLVPQSALHRWLVGELEDWPLRRRQRLAVLAPRGSAKTTWSTFAYPLWAAVYRQEPYVILTSDTGDQAHGYLEAVRRELESNEALARDYPSVCGAGSVWRGGRIRLKNGVVIEAYGTGAKIRGRQSGASRPSLIILDDPQNKEHVVSALMRERTWQWLARDVLNAVSPRTNVLALGTALHRDGIMCRLQTPEFGTGWRVKVFQSITQWPTRMDLWQQWQELLQDREDDRREERARLFYLQNRAAMEE